ncbi:MAG TPA: phosphoglucosamine mutase [Clostridia bacterium]|jgi:phosphoglucosamine mutase|nr:phosphoglucosamine mutase [Clostridia bacterium]
MGRLFGTDGVRGVANKELSAELAYKLGRAGAYILTKGKIGGKILIGRDTRISGQMLEAALAAGICSVGCDAVLLDVVPTPGVAFLTKDLQADAGVVISASHNPAADNGIKFFSSSGYKLSDELEDQIEELINNGMDSIPSPVGAEVGRIYSLKEAEERYIKYIVSLSPVDFRGLKVVIDCANGAASRISPEVFRRLGADVITINNGPDGLNINVNCGSTHPEQLQREVIACGADLGIAHDGDADRVIAVDHRGRVVDGDKIMAICGFNLLKRNALPHNTLVTTVMSNFGLDLAWQEAGGRLLKTQVGDRYVLEEMLKGGYSLGGEQSGHIIFLNHSTTGDGIITAVQLLAACLAEGKPLADLADLIPTLPQTLINVQVKDKSLVDRDEVIQGRIKELEKNLHGHGRILIRPSGTEPVVRVMVEGEDQQIIEEIAKELADLIRDRLG